MSIHNTLPEMENQLRFTHHQSLQPEAAKTISIWGHLSIHSSNWVFLILAWRFLYFIFFALMAVFFPFSECFCICSVGGYKGEKCRIWMREILCVDNSCTSTQATHALFTQVASTPGELLAAVLLASSQPGLEDLMQIICFSTTRKGKGEGFRRDFVSSCSSV